MSVRGKLIICATPIGNLSDISSRLKQALEEADIILSEHPSHTLRLLNYLGVKKPLRKYHENNPQPALKLLLSGYKVALLSSAGTPGVSDPGRELVRLCYENDIEVESIPGPSALCLAISYAPFRTKPLTFGGFPPRKGSVRERYLRELLSLTEHAILFFEGTKKVEKLLREIALTLSEFQQQREVLILRELTKINEEKRLYLFPRDLERAIKELKPRGEFSILLSPADFIKDNSI